MFEVYVADSSCLGQTVVAVVLFSGFVVYETDPSASARCLWGRSLPCESLFAAGWVWILEERALSLHSHGRPRYFVGVLLVVYASTDWKRPPSAGQPSQLFQFLYHHPDRTNLAIRFRQ